MVEVVRSLRYSIDRLEQTEAPPDSRAYLVAKSIIRGSYNMESQRRYVKTASKRHEITLIQKSLEQAVNEALDINIEAALNHVLSATESAEIFGTKEKDYRGIILGTLYKLLSNQKSDYRRDRLTNFGSKVISSMSRRNSPVLSAEEEIDALDYKNIPENLRPVYRELHYDFRVIRAAAKEIGS